MKLTETFKHIQNGIVALGSRLVPTTGDQQPLFPTIIGTGFVVDERGLVVTNKHVAETLMRLPAHPVTGQPSAFALVWLPVHNEGDQHTLPTLLVGLRAFFLPESMTVNGPYFGEAIPDVAFVQLNVRELNVLRLATQPNSLEVGMSIATAGFPSGADVLTVYGRLTQVSPMLRAGVVSSVIPFQCPLPHGFTIDAMVQGGASGSPVFRHDSPEVIGIVHAYARSSINTTLCIPSTLIAAALQCICQDGIDCVDVPTLEQASEGSNRTNQLEYERIPIIRTIRVADAGGSRINRLEHSVAEPV